MATIRKAWVLESVARIHILPWLTDGSNDSNQASLLPLTLDSFSDFGWFPDWFGKSEAKH